MTAIYHDPDLLLFLSMLLFLAFKSMRLPGWGSVDTPEALWSGLHLGTALIRAPDHRLYLLALKKEEGGAQDSKGWWATCDHSSILGCRALGLLVLASISRQRSKAGQSCVGRHRASAFDCSISADAKSVQ